MLPRWKQVSLKCDYDVKEVTCCFRRRIGSTCCLWTISRFVTMSPDSCRAESVLPSSTQKAGTFMHGYGIGFYEEERVRQSIGRIYCYMCIVWKKTIGNTLDSFGLCAHGS